MWVVGGVWAQKFSFTPTKWAANINQSKVAEFDFRMSCAAVLPQKFECCFRDLELDFFVILKFQIRPFLFRYKCKPHPNFKATDREIGY